MIELWELSLEFDTANYMLSFLTIASFSKYNNKSNRDSIALWILEQFYN